MQNFQFSFLNQAAPVEELLIQCKALVDHLPAHETGDLVAAMRVFENTTVPYYFDLECTEGDANEIEATVGEQLEALNRFAKYTAHHESDQVCLDQWVRKIVQERKLHIKVEYDTPHAGGEYSSAGQAVLVPLDLIETFEKEGSDEPVEAAFRKHTQLDMYLIHYTRDELYNEHGERVEAPLHGMPEKLECAGCGLPTQVDDDGLCNHCHDSGNEHAEMLRIAKVDIVPDSDLSDHWRWRFANTSDDSYIAYSSHEKAVTEAASMVASRTKGFHDLSDAFWDGLAPRQRLELVQEAFN